MFSLIITIISIALVAALALATLYFGGDAFNKGDAQSRATQVVTQGQQVLAASDMFFADKGRWPNSIEELVASDYLKQVPTVSAFNSEWNSAITSAHAASIAWTMPVAGRPTFVLASGISPETCQFVNLKVRGDNGILKKAYRDNPTQCYGSGNTLSVVVTKESASLELSLGAETVAEGSSKRGAPAADAYSIAPGSSAAAPTETPAEPALNGKLTLGMYPMGAPAAYYGSPPDWVPTSTSLERNPLGVWELSNTAQPDYYRIGATIAVIFTATEGDAQIGHWGRSEVEANVRELNVQTGEMYNAALKAYFISEGLSDAEAQAQADSSMPMAKLPSGEMYCTSGQTLAQGSSCYVVVGYMFWNNSQACGVDVPVIGAPVNLVLRPCQL